MIPISRTFRGKTEQVGFVRDKTYFSQRNFFRNQIFKSSKFGSAIAIDLVILKKLIKLEVKKIIFQIIGFEENTFELEISMEDFLKKSTKHHFKRDGIDWGEQRLIRMEFCQRIYQDQGLKGNFEFKR